MTVRRRVATVLVGSLLVLGAVGCSEAGAGTPVAGGDGSNFIQGDGTVTFVPPADREPAPSLSGSTLAGTPVDLASYQGDVVVLNVWASWCGPCRAEAPALQAVSEETRNRGVRFLGINTRDDNDKAEAFNRAFNISYPSIVDQSGSLLVPFNQTIPLSTIPSTVIVDRQGRIAVSVTGPTSYTQLKQLVTKIAAERS